RQFVSGIVDPQVADEGVADLAVKIAEAPPLVAIAIPFRVVQPSGLYLGFVAARANRLQLALEEREAPMSFGDRHIVVNGHRVSVLNIVRSWNLHGNNVQQAESVKNHFAFAVSVFVGAHLGPQVADAHYARKL